MDTLLVTIKKYIPRKIFLFLQKPYHFVFNFLAALIFGFPSKHMVVVGITGTTGKTTTVFLLAQILKNAGVQAGYTSTALFSDGNKQWLNDKKMTMLGRFFTQKMLWRMRKNGCTVAIVETTSEGIVQFRHRFINYDVLLFTGLYPEHIDSHGSFENYKKAKLSLFEHLQRCAKKTFPVIPDVAPGSLSADRQIDSRLRGNDKTVKKTIVVNADDEHAKDFLSVWAEKKIVFSKDKNCDLGDADVLCYRYKQTNKKGVLFSFDERDIQLQLLGEFTATNAAAAGTVARVLGLSGDNIKKSLESIVGIPGRLEKIDEGQAFTVIVDYAFEPRAVSGLYQTLRAIQPKKIIHVLGSTGGGRDVSRREKLGKLAGENASVVIVTNEDPYDDDPMEIIRDVAQGAKKCGKKEGEDLFLIESRKEAITKAVQLAQEADAVLITGKGSEQAIAVARGKKIPWDDRRVVREVLKKRKARVEAQKE